MDTESMIIKVIDLLSENMAVFGTLMGICVTYFLTIQRDKRLEKSQRKIDSDYTSIKLISELDSFVFRCVDVVNDNGLYRGQYNKDGCAESQVQTPCFAPDSLNVDLKCLRPELSYKVIYLPNKVSLAEEKISFIDSHIATPPDYDEYFEARQVSYSELGTYAFELSAQLRTELGIDDFESPYTKHPNTIFIEKRKEIEDLNEARLVERLRSQAQCSGRASPT